MSMSYSFFASRRTILLAAVLIVILGALAALQYRWLGEVSEAEESRLRTTVRAAANGVAAEFDGEIDRAQQCFQGAVEQPHQKITEIIPAALRRWRSESRWPKLLASEYVANVDATGTGALEQWNDSANELASRAWPISLDPIRRFFQEGGPRGRIESPLALPASLLVKIPALVVPLVSPSPTMASGSAGVGRDRFFINSSAPNGTFPPQPGEMFGHQWIILAFDRTEAERKILPALVAKHLAALTDFDTVIVRESDRARVVYRSRPGLDAASLTDVDASAPIFSVPTPYFFGSITFSGSPPPFRDLSTSAWTILLTHRAGKLQQVVETNRRRNLFASAGILVLFGAAIVLLVESARRARELARQQVEFVAGLTHELRTPLASIRAAGENLADDLIHSPARVREYGTLIAKEGKRLTELIERSLAQAGIGRAERPRPTLVPIDETIDEAIAASVQLAREQRSPIVREGDASGRAVLGDAADLRTIMENLIANAVKYGGPSGSVIVTTHVEGSEVTIAVSDSGPGIAPADLPHIFEPFFRGRGQASGPVPGTGLGLALVKRITAAHGWRIEADSTPGRGSTFQITLPVGNGEGGNERELHRAP